MVADATHKAWRAYSQVMRFVSAEMESFTFHFEALMMFLSGMHNLISIIVQGRCTETIYMKGLAYFPV